MSPGYSRCLLFSGQHGGCRSMWGGWLVMAGFVHRNRWSCHVKLSTYACALHGATNYVGYLVDWTPTPGWLISMRITLCHQLCGTYLVDWTPTPGWLISRWGKATMPYMTTGMYSISGVTEWLIMSTCQSNNISSSRHGHNPPQTSAPWLELSLTVTGLLFRVMVGVIEISVMIRI